MPVCAQCGAYVGFDDTACPGCGAAATTGSSAGSPPPPGPSEGQGGAPPAQVPPAPFPAAPAPPPPDAGPPAAPGYSPPPPPPPYTPPPPPQPGGYAPAPPPPGPPGAGAPPTWNLPPSSGPMPGAPPPGYGPPGGAYAPGPYGYGPPGGGPANTGLAGWGPRAGGLLIDLAIILVVAIPLDAIAGALGSSALVRLFGVIPLIGWIWWSVQVGQTGQSPGMRMVGLRCVSQQTGQVIGPGLAIVRWVAHILDAVTCFVGWLFPIWDKNRQTFADKITGTVVLRVPSQPFSLVPPSA